MNRQALADARQLVRLRTLREDAARTEHARCRSQQAACEAAVQQRLAQIATLRGTRAALLRWRAGEGAAEAPRLAPFAAARLEALDDQIERAEVELIDERRALQQASAATAAAHAAWQRALARREAVQSLADTGRRLLARAIEQRSEREAEARVPLEPA